MKRLVVTTGGTGGHIFPALAVCEALKALNPGLKIVFVGGSYGLEKELAARAGLPFIGLFVRGFYGRGIKSVIAVSGLLVSLVRICIYLLRFRPQAVVGFGGYAGFAPVLAAAVLRIPCALHEQNSVAGMANRILGRFVKRVFITYPAAAEFFPESETFVTGNPVRNELLELNNKNYNPSCGVKKKLLILGGSQGARALNEAMICALPKLAEMDVSVWHQSGKADYERVLKAYEDSAMKADDYRVSAFIEDMALAYSSADLVMCRCGASTIAELCVVGRGALLVPLVGSAGDHQFHNARTLEESGAAMIITEKKLKDSNWSGILSELLADTSGLKNMASAAKNMGRPYAARELAAKIEELTKDY